VRWTGQVRPDVLARLRVRAAQEQRDLRDVVAAALALYLDTPLPAGAVRG
jgi:hypothetical protein